MNRKSFLIKSLLLTLPVLIPGKRLSIIFPKGKKYFNHGIASGDPTDQAVVIWTRIDDVSSAEKNVEWEMTIDKNFKKIEKKGSFLTSEKRDYTVKIDVDGLKQDTEYYYRFKYLGDTSETGKCKTLPDDISNNLQIAVVSCNNYEDGYLTSFKHIANNKNIDYVFHLGDYIYEYATGKYCNKEFLAKTGRINDPQHEIITLSDYRKRYALYRKDSDIQKVHQKKSFFCIWDDHELANNAYKEGAKNHQKNEGDWNHRKQAAMQAYFEWMPVRANSLKEMIRTVKIGKDASFYFLEERLDGRDKQLLTNDSKKESSERKMISENQFNALNNELKNSDARWNFLVNQVMFTGYNSGKEKEDKEEDWWTGYPYQRDQLMKTFQDLKNPPIILTGDHHQSHVLELKSSENPEKLIAWEFLTPSITSKNDDRLSKKKILEKRERLYELNPHLIYNDTSSHGYFILKVQKNHLSFSYKFNEDILIPYGGEIDGPEFIINSQNQLTKNV